MKIKDILTEAKISDEEMMRIMNQIAGPEAQGGQYDIVTGNANKNKKLTAFGKYQIIMSTWNGMKANLQNGTYDKLGIKIDPDVRKAILAMPVFKNREDYWKALGQGNMTSFHEKLQDTAALLLGQENAANMVARGVPVNTSNMYMYHFLGPKVANVVAVALENDMPMTMKQAYEAAYADNPAEGRRKYEDDKKNNPGYIADDNATIQSTQTAMNTALSGWSGASNEQLTASIEQDRGFVDKALGLFGADEESRDKVAGSSLSQIWKNIRGVVTGDYGDDEEVKPGGTVSAQPEKGSTDDRDDYRGSGNPMSAEIERLRKATANQKQNKADADARADAINAEVGGASNVNDLAKANNIKDANKIQVGQKITMPDGSTYTVKSGDTLSKITKDFNARIDQARQDTIQQTVSIIQNPEKHDPETVELAKAELADEYADLADAFGPVDDKNNNDPESYIEPDGTTKNDKQDIPPGPDQTVDVQPDTTNIDPNQVNYIEPDQTVDVQPDTAKIDPNQVNYIGPPSSSGSDQLPDVSVQPDTTRIDPNKINYIEPEKTVNVQPNANVSVQPDKKTSSTQPDDYAGIKDDEWEYLNGKSKAERGVATTKESRDKYLNYIGILESKMKSNEFLKEAGAFDTSAMANAQTSANKVAVQNKPAAPVKTAMADPRGTVTMGQGPKPAVSAQPAAGGNKFDSKSGGAVAAFGAKTGPNSGGSVSAQPATKMPARGQGGYSQGGQITPPAKTATVRGQGGYGQGIATAPPQRGTVSTQPKKDLQTIARSTAAPMMAMREDEIEESKKRARKPNIAPEPKTNTDQQGLDPEKSGLGLKKPKVNESDLIDMLRLSGLKK